MFSWLNKRNKSTKKDPSLTSLSMPRSDEGAVDIRQNEGYDLYSSMHLDIDQVPTDEYKLIKKYREIALHPIVEEAIEEITNEAIINEDFKDIVDINLDALDLSDNIKKKIIEEFKYILKLLNFKTKAYGYFRKW